MTIDMAGKKYGEWLVVKRAKTDGRGEIMWECVCSCGKIKEIRGSTLRIGTSTCCGHSRRSPLKTHGMSNTKIFGIWRSMLSRCENKNCAAYKDYGARGITVCDEWHSFDVFFADMGHRPEGKSLDRIDNDKGYCKENCRWASRDEQIANRRASRRVSINGETKTFSQWEKHFGLPDSTISNRVRKGWDPVRAATTPVRAMTRNAG